MILIAIGANLVAADGTRPLETCRRAVTELGRLAGLRLTGVSRWYESAPVPPSGQDLYVNGVARLSAAPADRSGLPARPLQNNRIGR